MSRLDYWPAAIIQDRYNGVYAGGSWLAISEADTQFEHGMSRVDWCLNDGPYGDDTDAMMFWAEPPTWIAVGNTPDAALSALKALGQGER